MKTTKLIAVILIACGGIAQAGTLDLGPNGTSYLRTYDFNELNGTEFNGQTVSIHLTFSTQVHLFENTYPNFMIGIAFQTSGGESFIIGNGYVMDINGIAMIGTDSPLGSSSTTNLMSLGLFPCAYGLLQPCDIYGVHFDLTMPTLDASIIGSEIELLDSDFIDRGRRTVPFRIGPQVPDNASSLLLMLVSLIGTILYATTNDRSRSVR